MNIPLDQFEQIISETILNRGLNYYEQGYVTDVIEIGSGEYEAIVLGSDQYTVSFKIEGNTIVEHYCDCPYDLGPVCKHLVAVIFHYQQDLKTIDITTATSTQKKKTKPRKKTTEEQIKSILKSVSEEEIKEFILGNAKKDRSFRNLFLASFSYVSEDQSKKYYQKQIHSILRSATDRSGFIGWSEMAYLNSAMQPLLHNAELFFKNKSYCTLIYMCTALLEEMTEAFQYADDSSGDIGYYIDFSMEMLHKTGNSEITSEIRQELFAYCIQAFEQQYFEGWDWHLGILQLANNLITEENQADIILAKLKSFQNEYEKERAQELELDIMSRFKKEEIVQDFVERNIGNSRIREREIEKAFDHKDYQRAITLAKDGINYDKDKKPGLLKTWYDWLLKIAEAQNDIPKIIEYAKYRLLNNFMANRDYYQILKDHIDPDGWESYVEGIIEEIKSQGGWIDWSKIREIYVREHYWDRLLVSIQEHPDLRTIEHFESYLKTDYSQELVELYSKAITSFLVTNVGRKYYQTACRYLRRMKKLGGTDEVNSLISELKDQYKQRRALLQELDNV